MNELTLENIMKRYLVIMALALSAAGCADMTPTQQRALTGTAIGAGGGAAIGAIAGNAGLGAGIGAGAGLLGGLLVDQSRQAQNRAFQQGFAAGQQRR
jgi:OmpA family protein